MANSNDLILRIQMPSDLKPFKGAVNCLDRLALKGLMRNHDFKSGQIGLGGIILESAKDIAYSGFISVVNTAYLVAPLYGFYKLAEKF